MQSDDSAERMEVREEIKKTQTGYDFWEINGVKWESFESRLEAERSTMYTIINHDREEGQRLVEFRNAIKDQKGIGEVKAFFGLQAQWI